MWKKEQNPNSQKKIYNILDEIKKLLYLEI